MVDKNPFDKELLLGEMYRCVIEHIRRPSFSFALPNLNAEAWKIICTDPRARERLEFLGDSIIGTQVSEGLIQHWPSESPNFYTKCRTVLVANATFAHLMWKAGICKLDRTVKPAGDAFEAILALYHEKHGLENSKSYIFMAFGPLFKTVGEAYFQNIDKSRKKKNRVQLNDRRLNQAAKSAKDMTSGSLVYHRHDTLKSLKLTLQNKKQRIYENQSPMKTPMNATTYLAGPSLHSQPQSNSRQHNVFNLTQGPNLHGPAGKPVRISNPSIGKDISQRQTVPNGPPSYPVKPEPFEPTISPSLTTNRTHAPVAAYNKLPAYPIFTSKQVMDNQTQAILISASESQEKIQNKPQPPLKSAVAAAPNPLAPPPAPPPALYPIQLPINTVPNSHSAKTTAKITTTAAKHKRVASRTADDLADMFASQATLAHALASSPTIETAPVLLPVPAPGHGTKENPITILDDD